MKNSTGPKACREKRTHFKNWGVYGLVFIFSIAKSLIASAEDADPEKHNLENRTCFVNFCLTLSSGSLGSGSTEEECGKVYRKLVEDIQARISIESKPEDIIGVLSDEIFYKLGIRPAPYGAGALQDLFKSKKGDCSDLCILYLCVAQSLNLPFKMVAIGPHSFISYRSNGVEYCVETTLRGIPIKGRDVLHKNIPILSALGYKINHCRELSLAEAAGVAIYESSILSGERDRDFGIKQLSKVLELYPEFELGRTAIGELLIRAGRTEDGKVAYARVFDQYMNQRIWDAALCCAVGSDNIASCERAIAEGADVNGSFVGGRRPVHYANSAGMIAWLKKCGARFDVCANGEVSALHFAAIRNSFSVFKSLVKDISDTADIFGNHSLSYACMGDSSEIVKFLLDSGIRVDQKNKFGEVALHHASKYGSIKCVATLLEAGADPTIADEDGQTPLHVAYQNYRAGVVSLLLKSGADGTIKDKFGKVPSDYSNVEATQDVPTMRSDEKDDEKPQPNQDPLPPPSK